VAGVVQPPQSWAVCLHSASSSDSRGADSTGAAEKLERQSCRHEVTMLAEEGSCAGHVERVRGHVRVGGACLAAL